MASILGVLFGVVMLIFLTYVAIFCGIGALLSRSRGGSAASGFLLGFFGPFGWAAIAYRTRHHRDRRDLGDLEIADEAQLLPASERPFSGAPRSDDPPKGPVPGAADF